SPLAGPRLPGRAIAWALAVASLTIEIGPCSPVTKIARVTSSGASVSACHSASLNADLSVIPALPDRGLDEAMAYERRRPHVPGCGRARSVGHRPPKRHPRLLAGDRRH